MMESSASIYTAVLPIQHVDNEANAALVQISVCAYADAIAAKMETSASAYAAVLPIQHVAYEADAVLVRIYICADADATAAMMGISASAYTVVLQIQHVANEADAALAQISMCAKTDATEMATLSASKIPSPGISSCVADTATAVNIEIMMDTAFAAAGSTQAEMLQSSIYAILLLRSICATCRAHPPMMLLSSVHTSCSPCASAMLL